MNKTAEDIKKGMSSTRSFFASLSMSKGEERNKYFNNPKTIYDELIIICAIVIWLCVGVTSYFGVQYHLSIFNADKSGNSNFIAGVSISFLIIGELIKVYFGNRFLMMALSGELSKGVIKIILWLFMLVVLYATYKWSIDISSVAFGSNITAKGKIDAMKTKTGTKGVKGSYEKRLQQIDKDIATAEKQTWKGKLTPDAKEAIKTSKSERKKVLSLIDKEMDSNMQSDSTTLAIEFEEILKNEKRVNDYGGKAELLLIFSLICSCLCKKSIDQDFAKNENSEQSQNDLSEAESTSKTEIKSFDAVKNNSIGFGKNSDGRPKIEARNPIGFNRNEVIKESQIVVLPVEKKTLVELDDDKILYEEGIKALNLLKKISDNQEEINLYNEGIKALELLIKLM